MCHAVLSLYLPTAPRDAPTVFSVRAAGPYNVTVAWGPPTVPNGVVTGYALYITFGNSSTTIKRLGGSDRQFTLTYLSPYETVTVSATARTIVGEGPRTSALHATTDEIGNFAAVLFVCFNHVLCFDSRSSFSHLHQSHHHREDL